MAATILKILTNFHKKRKFKKKFTFSSFKGHGLGIGYANQCETHPQYLLFSSSFSHVLIELPLDLLIFKSGVFEMRRKATPPLLSLRGRCLKRTAAARSAPGEMQRRERVWTHRTNLAPPPSLSRPRELSWLSWLGSPILSALENFQAGCPRKVNFRHQMQI